MKTVLLLLHVFFGFFLIIFIVTVMENVCSYLFDGKLLSYYEDCFFGLACLFRLLLVIFITRVMGNTSCYPFDGTLLSYYEDCSFALACLFRLLSHNLYSYSDGEHM